MFGEAAAFAFLAITAGRRTERLPGPEGWL
jgi:hypothetical protein